MEKGISHQEAKEKLLQFGKNEITSKEQYSVLSLFFSQFPSVINGILFFASVFSLVIADVLDGVLILFILLLNALFGFFQEYKAEKSLKKLKSLVTSLSRVIRQGKEFQIPSSKVVPGDLIVLSEGDRVPADGKLTHCMHCEIDESILTGESIPVIRKDGETLFSSTLIIKGKGYLTVEKTGMNTRFGKIAKTLATLESDTSPLTKNLSILGKILSFGALSISFSLIPIGLIQGRPLFPLILLAVSIAVAAIPEGLPAVITIALAIGTNRMAKKNAIIRKMPAIETLGSVQVILTDKTGTLTQNNMRVKKFWMPDSAKLEHLLKACVLGNTASLINKDDDRENFDIIGDKTDGALLLFSKEHKATDFAKEGKVIDEYFFDPQIKTIATVFEENKKKYVFVRGAPEEIIQKSKLTQKEKEEIIGLYESYAKEGLRVIAFGAKHERHTGKSRAHLEENLNFLGFVGIYDPPRPEAAKTLREAELAGIHIVMVTGDNELTALAIAKEIGLIQKDEDILTGEKLQAISDEELKKIIIRIRVFARTQPEDKLRLVNVFKEMGYIVGVTGDGVNDTLALKRADVGIAMGQKGTDVAIEASDIVLTDDNFATLVKAVEEGRTIYNNITKAITYLLSGNLAEISLVFFATVFGIPSPLLPTQILWINIVTDGLPALALASDSKDKSLLTEKPRDPKQPILTKKRIIFTLCVGLGLAAILLVVFKILLTTTNETFARTITFNLLVFFHVLIAFFVRGTSIFKAGRFLILTFLATIVIQIIISTVPFFQTIFHLGF